MDLYAAGRLVDDVGVLAALDARGRRRVVREVKRRFASPRDIARPAPWLQLSKLSGCRARARCRSARPCCPG
jgi:hypothetical protein